MLPGSLVVTSRQEQTTERDEDVATPASCPARGEVRQASGEGRNWISWVERRGLHQAVHLDGAERKILSEGVTVGNEFGALFHDRSASCLVRFKDDDGEVFRSKEGGHSSLDFVEAFLEPRGWLDEMGEGRGLPGRILRSVRFTCHTKSIAYLSKRECT